MVDPTTPHSHRDAEVLKIKNLMNRTPSMLKSKFLSVLGSSNDIITGLSNKIDVALSLTSSSETETTENKSNRNPGDLMDDDIVDFESRRVKERRAHEEVLSGRYRHPIFMEKVNQGLDDFEELNQQINSISTDVSNSNISNSVESKSSNVDVESIEAVVDTHSKKCISDLPQNISTNSKKKTTISSSNTSENDLCKTSISLESSDLKMCIRSESTHSVPSWASSISLDSQTEEGILAFMRNFVKVLFQNSGTITLELKSEFGLLARTESGRLWFARLVNTQRSQSKRVNESTFYSLVQFFAIVLFECAESDDFTPAKSLMNMCFTFFHDIDVPGCEPYREYLYTYLREQPIWHSLRFWNAAFFDALQGERAHRPIPVNLDTKRNSLGGCSQNSDMDSVSYASSMSDHINELNEDQTFQKNITFGQLGTFTYNMHAFGLSIQLCNEFLRKQATIANLSKDQQNLLRDNINRMYRETDKWRN